MLKFLKFFGVLKENFRSNLLPNHLSSLMVQNYNLTLKVTLEQIHLDSVCWNCVLIMDCSSTSFLTDMKIYRAIMRLFLYCTSFLWRNCLPSLNMMEAVFSPVCRLIRMMCSNPAVYLNFNLSQTWYTNCPKTESTHSLTFHFQQIRLLFLWVFNTLVLLFFNLVSRFTIIPVVSVYITKYHFKLIRACLINFMFHYFYIIPIKMWSDTITVAPYKINSKDPLHFPTLNDCFHALCVPT